MEPWEGSTPPAPGAAEQSSLALPRTCRRSLEYIQYSALRCSLHPARLRSATLGPAIRNRLLAIQNVHQDLGIARAGRHALGRDAIDFGQVIGGQLDLQRLQVLAQI